MCRIKRPNYTQVPNDILGDLTTEGIQPGILAELGYADLKVLLAIIRLTFGYHKTDVRVSLTNLATLTGLARDKVVDGIKRLEDAKLVVAERYQGVNKYRLLVAEGYQTGSETLPPSKKEKKESNTDTMLFSRPDPIAYFLKAFGGKRLNPTQRSTLLSLCNQYPETYQAAVTWTANMGMAMGQAINALPATLEKWGKRKAPGPVAVSRQEGERVRMG